MECGKGMQVQKINYQKELDQILEALQKEGRVPRLLLHSCCAPCSSYVLEYLSDYFEITVFYYNPNIYPEEEYYKRVEEQQMLIGKLTAAHPISFLEGMYDPERFYRMAAGLERVKEGGERCFGCYALRLKEAADKAKEGGFDYLGCRIYFRGFAKRMGTFHMGAGTGFSKGFTSKRDLDDALSQAVYG